MQKCSSCGTPLNEFDVSFHQALFKKKDTNGCKCLHCGTSNAMKDAIRLKELGLRQWFGKTFWLHFIPLAFTALCIIGGIADNDGLTYGGLIGAFFSYMICGVIMACSVGDGDLYVVGHHYESSVSSSGTIVTKRVDEYSGGSCANFFFLFFYWAICLPHWIIRGIKCAIYRKKLRDACPDGFWDAYEAAVRKHRKTTIPKERVNAYHNAQSRYNGDIKKVEDNYGFMGDAEVQKRKDYIKPPRVSVQAEERRYLLVKYEANSNIKAYLLYRDNAGKICGKIVINNYSLYTTTPNWQADWDELNGAGSAEKALKDYSNFL